MKTNSTNAHPAYLKLIRKWLSLGLLSTLGSSAFAATLTWTTGDGGDGLWSNTSNWGGSTLASGDSVVFGATTGTTTLNNDLSINTTGAALGVVTFNANATAYTIGGNAIAGSLGGFLVNSASNITQTININFTGHCNAVPVSGAGNITFGGTLTKGGTWNPYFQMNGTGVLTLNGSGNLNTAGGTSPLEANSGTVVLAKTTAGGFNVGLRINGGTVKLGYAEQFRSGQGLTINGGTLDLNGIDSAQGGNGSAVATGTGTTTGGIGQLTGLGGRVTNNTAGTGTNWLVINGVNQKASYGGTITDGATAKVGLSVLTNYNESSFHALAGNNTYSGGTFIQHFYTGSGGRPTILSIGNVASIGSSGYRNLTFKGGAASADVILQLTGTAVTNSNQFNGLTFTSGLGAGFDIADPNNTFTLGKNAGGTDIAFTGGGVFEKLGAGTLVIASNLAYTGGTYLGGGTLKIDAQNGGVLASTSAPVFAGGNLYLLGKTSGTTTQTLGNVSLAALNNYGASSGGASMITVDANGGAGTTLALGTLPNSTSAGYTLNIKTLTGGQVSTTTTTTTNGLVGNGRILFTNASGVTDFASIPGSGTRYIQAATYSGGLPTSGTTTLNYSQSDNASVTADATVNALRLTTSTDSQSLAITSGQTLSLTSGGLLFIGANDYSITGGTLKSINSATTPDLIVHQYGAGALTIGSVIANGGTGASTLTKAGAGTLVLSGANTYTGQTYITGGILSISSDSNIAGFNGTFANLTSDIGSSSVTYTGSLPTGFGVGSTMLGRTVNAINTGTSTITLSGNAGTGLSGGTASWVTASAIGLYSGGVLQATGNITLQESNTGGTAGTTTVNRGITIGNSGGGFDVTGANTLTITGGITATGMLTKSGTGTLTLGAANNLTGGITINEGTVKQNIANSLTNSNSSTATSNLIFGNGTAPKLQLNNFDTAVTSLVSSNVNAIVENGAAGTKTLTVVNGADNTYAGKLQNGSAGVLALAKSGGGTLTLSNASNAFTGGLTIYNGILEGSQAGTLGSGTITLANGTLKATGAFTNAIDARTNYSNNSAYTTTFLNNTIDISGGDASFSGVFSNSGAVNKTGANTLTLSNAANTYTGTLTATTGTVSFASMGATAALTMAGGNFTCTGNTTVRSLAVNSAGTLAVSATNNQRLTVGSLSGSQALTVTGAGSAYFTGLILTGTSNSGFNGTISTGASLNLVNENLLGTNANALTMSGGILGDYGSPLTIANHSIALTGGITIAPGDATGDMTITGGITGTGNVTYRSETSRAIVLGGTNTYNGTSDIYTDNIKNSTLRMGAANALPSGTGKGNLQLTAWNTGVATLDLNGNSQTVNGLISSGSTAATKTVIDNVTAGGTATLTVGANNATGNTFAGVIKNTTGTVNLEKTGTGTQTLTGANTYSGGTTINAGTLALSGSGSLSDLTAVEVNSPGSFDISGISSSEKIASLRAGSGSSLKLGAKSLEFGDASDTSFEGSIDSSTGGELKKVGTGAFTLAASGYTGTGPKINVSMGTLLTGVANLPSSSAFTLSGGALNTGTFSNTVGSLTVTSGSVINFAGGGTPVLTFASQGTWSGLLEIWNWTGSAGSLGTGGKLKFTDGVDGTLIDPSKIQFYSGAGTGSIGTGGVFIGTELVPVPEPATLISCSMLFGLIVSQRRRQVECANDA